MRPSTSHACNPLDTKYGVVRVYILEHYYPFFFVTFHPLSGFQTLRNDPATGNFGQTIVVHLIVSQTSKYFGMKLTVSTLLSISVLAVSEVQAWGVLAHQAMALLAENYLLPKTVTRVQAILNDNSAAYMGNVATWADKFRGEFPQSSYQSYY
jgi:hypothetical protein